MIEVYDSFYEEMDIREEEEKRELAENIRNTTRELIEKYGLEEDLAEVSAESAWKVEKMGLDYSESYFWDDDFSIVFGEGFVNGIRSLVSGSAALMGYGYEDVCSIFTDAGIRVPPLLVGTKTAFDTVGKVTQEKRTEAINNMLLPGLSGDVKEWLKEHGYDEDDLPFS